MLEIVTDLFKTVRVSVSVWKRLSHFKIDYDKDTYEDAIDELLDERGY